MSGMTVAAARRAALRPGQNDSKEQKRGLHGLLAPLLVINVLALPLLIPRGPGNTAPPDMVMIPFTILGAAALWRMRTRIRFPLVGFYLLIVFGGVIAVTNSIVPRRSALAVLEDGYLFVWFLVTLNLLREGTGRVARLVAGAWVVAGVTTALLTWGLRFTFPLHVPVFFGYRTVSQFGRVSATFEDPNLAGNYLVVSLFVMWASPWPRSRKMKLALTVPFLFGIWSTSSITALATVAGGTIAAGFTSYVARRASGLAIGLALIGVALAGVSFLPSDIGTRSERLTQALGKSGAFQGSIGRTQKSLSPRLERIVEAFRFFGSDILIGIGPSATSTTLQAAHAPIGGEIHNDYAAGFLERGLLGGIGVLGLFVTALWWSARTGTDRALRAAGWRPAAFTGATIAVMMAAFSLETLHFRHVWALFALTVALGLGRRSDPATRTGSLEPSRSAGQISAGQISAAQT
jgi:hypothetical protein